MKAGAKPAMNAGTSTKAWIDAQPSPESPPAVAPGVYPPGGACPRECGATLYPSREHDEQSLCLRCGFVAYTLPTAPEPIPADMKSQARPGKPRGKMGGRPKGAGNEQVAERRKQVAALTALGYSSGEIAAAVGCSKASVQRDWRILGVSNPVLTQGALIS